MQLYKRLGTALCFLGNVRPRELDAEIGKLPSPGMPTQTEDLDPGSNSLLALIGKICQSPWNGARGNCFQPVLLPSNRTAAQQVRGKQEGNCPWNKSQDMRVCLSPLFIAAQILFPFFKCSTPNQTQWKKSSWINIMLLHNPSQLLMKRTTEFPLKGKAEQCFYTIFYFIWSQDKSSFSKCAFSRKCASLLPARANHSALCWPQYLFHSLQEIICSSS